MPNDDTRPLLIFLTAIALLVGQSCILQREPPPRLPTVEVVTPTWTAAPTNTPSATSQPTPTPSVVAADTATPKPTITPAASPTSLLATATPPPLPTFTVSPSPTSSPTPRPTEVWVDVAEGFGVKMRKPVATEDGLTCTWNRAAFAAIYYPVSLELRETVKAEGEDWIIVWLPDMHMSACIVWRYVDKEAEIAMRWRVE